MEYILTTINLFMLTILLLIQKSEPVIDVSPNDVHCFGFDVACSQCIQEPNCQWCSHAKNLNSSEHHCFSVTTDLSADCEEIENPQNSNVQMILDNPLTEKKGEIESIVQLRPQHIKFQLRKGEAVNFTLSYRQVKDYPLDLYYLMDLSKSMYEDKLTLARLGKKLAKTMRKLTKQFKIGFGSFVDKVMLPFVNIHPSILRTPCDDLNCATPFSFKNNLPLNEEDQEFVKQVEEAQISSNIDSPEGGFDALMQAMVCEEEIGWRKNVRKIIIFSTDALSHTAGDGKLAGIITPNDGICHLGKDGYYEDYDKYDYPSIGQIDVTAQERGINIIFAVKEHADFYKKLSERIEGSSFGELSEDSDNIIDLVTKVYNSITGKVEMNVRSRSSPVSVRFFTDCGIKGAPLKETNICNDVKEGASFNYTVEIMVTNCPKGVQDTQIEIGTRQDSLLVDLELLCHCGCERNTHKGYEENSPRCSGSGTKQCEVCDCNQGFYGQFCQCSKNKNKIPSEEDNDQRKCRQEGSSSQDSVCNGKGRCECETCICWKERHFGRYCQCDKGMCRQNINSNVECSGNGRCDCNLCSCNPGWEGQFCECRSKLSCVPNSGKICSGNGNCHCGKCECKESFGGKYCEDCSICGEGKCFQFRPCVQCDVWGSGELQGAACKNCSFKPITTNNLEPQLRQSALLCTFEDEKTGCNFNFTYEYITSEDGYKIYAQDTQECPEKIHPLAVTFGVICGIVAIGVLTLIIWKILTTYHDRREYLRFEKERQNAAWNTAENPLYESATTTVSNPAFLTK